MLRVKAAKHLRRARSSAERSLKWKLPISIRPTEAVVALAYVILMTIAIALCGEGPGPPR